MCRDAAVHQGSGTLPPKVLCYTLVMNHWFGAQMMLTRILTLFANGHTGTSAARSRWRNACLNRVPEVKEFERCFVDDLGISCSDMSFRTGHDTQAEPREDGQRYSRNPKTYKYPALPRYPPAGVVHISRRSVMNNLQQNEQTLVRTGPLPTKLQTSMC